jgi:hypothetical protein
VFPSHWTPVSLAISVLAGVGLVAIVRESWRTSLILLSSPVLYLLFLSSYSVMHVRNLLLIGVIIAILAARGITLACDSLGLRLAGPAAGLALAGLIAVNGGWLIYAGESIRAPRSQFTEELVAYTEARPDLSVYLSPELCEELAGLGRGMRSNHTCDSLTAANLYAYLTPEVTRSGGENQVPSNWRNLTRAVFGPHEVNFDYYSSWTTNRHIRISNLEGAKAMGFPFESGWREAADLKSKAIEDAFWRDAARKPR